ncbi:Hsp70 family protein [soil metagenome]
MSGKPKYVVGIDLGTTNTVVAYGRLGAADVELFEIDQLVAPGEVAARALLPSVRYHPAEGELGAGETQLPWSPQPVDAGAIIGKLALELGAQVPGRLVASAKSWLSHASVDRTAAILPWGADESVAKVSPVAASASYLAHVRAAWNTCFPKAPLEAQQIVLTVPASFDEGARALTVEAARRAGLPKLHLLEEPQAALYDWLFQHRGRLADELAETRLVLVCDVGGGTTDLSLIQVEMIDGAPVLTRVGVGDHLMLGGDNMDLALAHHAEQRLGGADAAKLSAARMSQLTQRCRAAKEQLLAADAPESVAVTLLGAGSKLIGGSRSVNLTRDEVRAWLVDGFFPQVAPGDAPQRKRAGIVEFGLPYASDPAITRHVAAFLGRHAAASRKALGDRAPADPAALPLPDTLLLNGGVFRADALAQRLAAVLGAWSKVGSGAGSDTGSAAGSGGGSFIAPTVLHNAHLDAAVARGAVAYALAREGQAPRIGGGSARSFFLLLDDAASRGKGGVEDSARGSTKDSAEAPTRRAICVLPRGTEEGRDLVLADRSFALTVGQPVQFHLVSSAADTAFAAGELVDPSGADFIRLPPIATVVDARGTTAGREVPVHLSASLTEVGTLELQCIADKNGDNDGDNSSDNSGNGDPPRRWRLEFQLRGDAPAEASVAAAHPRLPDAVERIDRVYGGRALQIEAKEVKQLRAALEKLLGERDTWDTPLLRELFGTLLPRARRRRRTATHERLWLSLAGYCLRPGVGDPLDGWRVEQLAALYEAGIQYTKESQLWSEWWTLWRRVAAGLSAELQTRILGDIAAALEAETTNRSARNLNPAQVAALGAHDDMLRLAASLEHVPVEGKAEFGDLLVRQLEAGAEPVQGWWAVGRTGARQPLFGSAHNVVPGETAVRWVGAILALDWRKVEPAAFAATQIARRTGDRARDLPDALRAEVIERLEAIHAPQRWIAMVREVVELDEGDTRRVFGDSLPAGLKLIG